MTSSLRIGDWQVDPVSGCIARDGQVVRLDGRTMDLLLYLADRAGEAVGIEELLDRVWSGVIVTQDSVYQAIASLRRLLGDDARQPTYIATVPRRGYRLLVQVTRASCTTDASITPSKSLPDAAPGEPSDPVPAGAGVAIGLLGQAAANVERVAPGSTPVSSGLHLRRGFLPGLSLACLAFAIGAGWYALHARAAVVPARSVAVLPFLNLTSRATDAQSFADGVTEELIDRLSSLPGMHVPSPASSFYFKGRNMPVADIARRLGVAYVISGSVRRSGTSQRISTRLVRAEDGYVLWSHDCDGPVGDELEVQDEIAGEVAHTLDRSIR